MKLWFRWAAHLGMAGACVMAVGCGGDSVPDTSTEGQAVAGGGGAAPSENPAAAPEPTTEVASAPNKEEAPAAAAQPSAPATPPAGAQAPAKKQDESATAQMLALATTPSPGSNPPASGGAAPNAPPGNAQPQPGAPGAPGQMGGMAAGMPSMMRGGPGRPGMGGPGGAPGAPGAAGAPGAPGAGGPGGNPGMMPGMAQMGRGIVPPGSGPNPGDMAKMMAGQMGANMANRPGAPGAGGANALSPGGGGPGGAGGDNGPADNRTPENAVRAFLKALKAKDKDALTEATAGHAPLEAREKNRDTFKKIIDLEISDSELDELTKALDGYRIASYNPPRSTGRLDVVIQKQGERGAFFRRRVTVRREKKGWGVLDISGAEEFKAIMNYGRRKR